MKNEDFGADQIGAVFLLVGGNLMRYQGPYGIEDMDAAQRLVFPKKCLAFRSAMEEASFPAVGYSASAAEVIRRITNADLDWLPMRREQAMARNLHGAVEDVDATVEWLSSMETKTTDLRVNSPGLSDSDEKTEITTNTSCEK